MCKLEECACFREVRNDNLVERASVYGLPILKTTRSNYGTLIKVMTWIKCHIQLINHVFCHQQLYVSFVTALQLIQVHVQYLLIIEGQINKAPTISESLLTLWADF